MWRTVSAHNNGVEGKREFRKALGSILKGAGAASAYEMLTKVNPRASPRRL